MMHQGKNRTSLIVVLIATIISQAVVPLHSAKSADVVPVWQALSRQSRNTSFTDAATDGRIVVNVGTHGTVALTQDRAKWEAADQFTSNDLYGICWGAGMFVTVGDDSTLFTSTDGRAWRERSLASVVSLASVAFGNGSFVAVGLAGTVLRSTDGSEWFDVGTPATGNLYDVIWGGGQFVAVGETGTIVTSPDGAAWTDRSFSSTADLYSVCWGTDKYVAVGGLSLILTSLDGSTWTPQTAVYEDLTFACVAWAGTAFVAAANFDAMRQTMDVPTRWAVFYFRSTDGTTWNTTTWLETYIWKRSSWVRGMLWSGSQLISFGDNNSIQASPDGMRWTHRSSAGNAIIMSTTSGAGTYVAVGTEDNFNGAVYSSDDGVTWRREVNPQTPRPNDLYEQWQDDLYSVAFGGGTFVAVGSHGVILRSDNGHDWTVQSTIEDSLLTVMWLGSLFVAAGDNGTLLTSPDGRVWTRRMLRRPNLLLWSMAASSDTVIFMGIDVRSRSSGTQILRVAAATLIGDGPVAPSSVTIGGSSGWMAQVAWGNNRFVAVADNQRRSWYSEDGVTWLPSGPSFIGPMRAIAFAQGVFVAVGDGQTIATSTDGITWNVRRSGSMGINPGDNEHSLLREDYISVYGDADRFVVTSSMNTIEISTDSGVNWSSTTDTSGDVTLTAAASTSLGLIVVGEDAHIRTSRDGAVWRRCSSDATGWLWDVTATSWGAVIVGELGTVLTSTDLVTWTSIADATTETLTGIAWSEGNLVAVGSARTVITSSDGKQWTQTDSGMSGDFYALAAGAGRFVAVGENGIVGTSADGTVWQPRTSGTTTDLNDIAFTGTVFVAVGGTGTVLTSPDGVTWSPQKSGTTSSLLGVAAYGGMVVAVGDKGTIIVSQDATGWLATPTPTREILYACAALDSTMVAVGGTSTVLRSASLAAPAVPQTVRPIASAVVDPASIVLEWNVAARALSYDVEVAATAAFAKTIVSRTAIAGTSLRVEPSGLPANAPLYWRVRARGVVFVSAWTTALAFTIRTAPPPPTRTALVLRVGSRTMTVDGVATTIDVAPQIIEGRTLLPVKWVAEPLGATVSWDGTQRKVSVSLGQKRLELWIGRSQALVNGVGVAIDSQNAKVVPLIISSRTMLPVRFVAEQLGADVQWEPTTRTITITYVRP